MRQRLVQIDGKLECLEEMYRLNQRLEQLIEVESDYWHQRSHSNYLANGDRNTSYFHHHASHRKCINRIQKICDTSDKVVETQKDILDVAVALFAGLFTTKHTSVDHDTTFWEVRMPQLSEDENARLAEPFTTMEV